MSRLCHLETTVAELTRSIYIYLCYICIPCSCLRDGHECWWTADGHQLELSPLDRTDGGLFCFVVILDTPVGGCIHTGAGLVFEKGPLKPRWPDNPGYRHLASPPVEYLSRTEMCDKTDLCVTLDVRAMHISVPCLTS